LAKYGYSIAQASAVERETSTFRYGLIGTSNLAATSSTANPIQACPTWREALKKVVWLLVHNEIESSVSGQLCTVL